MSLFRTLFAATCMAGLLVPPAMATPRAPSGETRRATSDRPRDQDRAYRSKIRGDALSYPEIKERIMPFMGDAVPLGPDIRGGDYLVKFMRGGRVIWVEVDPSTGKILGRTR